jgi:hypothetical protein
MSLGYNFENWTQFEKRVTEKRKRRTLYFEGGTEFFRLSRFPDLYSLCLLVEIRLKEGNAPGRVIMWTLLRTEERI